MQGASRQVLEKADQPPLSIGIAFDVALGRLQRPMTGKLLDVTKIRALGWQPSISLRKGIAKTYEWFLANRGQQ